jgi:5'-3' exonuclease
MHFVSDILHFYVQDRVAASKAWASLQVFVSDVTVPGEGEHKIMDFIRYARSLPDYNANMQHCVYGADADLFMLTLATHEPRFTILREATEEVQCSR